MIVKMKKVTIIVKALWKDEVLKLLGAVGVLHIRSTRHIEDEKVEELRENILLMEKALSMLHDIPDKKGIPDSVSDRDGLLLARRLIEHTEKRKELEAEIKQLKAEYERAAVWGRFDPEDINIVREKGLTVQLFQCHEREFKKTGRSDLHVISRKGGTLFIAAFSDGGSFDLPFQEVEIPSRGVVEIERLLEEGNKKLLSIKKKLTELSEKAYFINETLMKLKNLQNCEEVTAGMGREGNLSFLVGFCPEPELKRLLQVAQKKQWGMLIEDPSDDDSVPTLIQYSRWTRLFRPVMDFLGVTPGYREYDTSAVFLIFFSIFFAILIGDGGYGMILFLATFVLKRSYKGISKETISLLSLASMATIFWGAVTGTWFGVEKISQLPVLRDLVIPGLYSYAKESEGTIVHLCFLIGALQLSIAHVWTAVRVYPSLMLFAEIGWALLVWGIYFIARFLTLNEEMSLLGVLLPFVGILMVIVFGEQKKDGLLKGMGRGLKGLPMSTLTGIGNLSDLISYVRLFAVGLATKEVAVAFNNMAKDIGFDTGFSIVLAVFVLVFGHGINLLLAAMAVLVHGVRLNLLEFSKHLNIQWSGVPFKPFKAMKS